MLTATNIDLDKAVANGKFREDLLYRIRVIQIDLPPLRERTGDILDLAARFVAELGGARAAGLTDQAADALRQYAWPGNVRELHNVIERALILSQGQRIGVEHLPGSFIASAATPTSPATAGDLVPLEKLEEIHIRRILARTKSLEEAAEVLGIDLATLWRRRKKYGI
jgi:NtrC-family two-component system response regulator AlgB